MEGALIYFLAPLLAFPLGFWAGRLRGPAPRRMALAGVLALPFVPTVVLLFASAPLTDEAIGWILGLSFIILFIPATMWLVLALIGFMISRGRASRFR